LSLPEPPQPSSERILPYASAPACSEAPVASPSMTTCRSLPSKLLSSSPSTLA